MANLHWRMMNLSDLPRVQAMADQIHPSFPEDIEVFRERQLLYPAGMQFLEDGASAAGYLISHPWRRGSMPALNCLIHDLPSPPDTYYLHDLALLPSARGTGAARFIIERVTEQAVISGFPTMSLVAVNGSIPFWRHHGFQMEENDALAEKLASYEPDARLMVRAL